MTRTRNNGATKALMVLPLAALAAAAPAAAHAGAGQRVWTTVSVQGRAGRASPWRWRADSLARTRDGAGTLDLLAQRVMLTRDLTRRSAVGFGYLYGASFPAAGPLSERRLVQQYAWTGGSDWRVSLRSRLEERFVTGHGAVRLRVRQQVRVSWPLTRTLRGVVSEELLVQANSTGRTPRGFDSNIAFLGVGRRLSPRTWLELGYVNVLARGAAGSNRLGHVVSATLVVSLRQGNNAQ
jgi:hypothetical protein